MRKQNGVLELAARAPVFVFRQAGQQHREETRRVKFMYLRKEWLIAATSPRLFLNTLALINGLLQRSSLNQNVASGICAYAELCGADDDDRPSRHQTAVFISLSRCLPEVHLSCTLYRHLDLVSSISTVFSLFIYFQRLEFLFRTQRTPLHGTRITHYFTMRNRKRKGKEISCLFVCSCNLKRRTHYKFPFPATINNPCTSGAYTNAILDDTGERRTQI